MSSSNEEELPKPDELNGENCIAFNLLDEFQMAKRLDETEADEYRAYFVHLYKVNMYARKEETRYLNLVRNNNTEIHAEKINKQNMEMAEQEEKAELARTEKEKERIQKEYDEWSKRDTMTTTTLTNMTLEHENLKGEVNNLLDANDKLVTPEFNRLNENVAQLQRDIENTTADNEKDLATKQKLMKALGEIERDLELSQSRNDELKQILKEKENDPDRISRQLVVVERAQKGLQDDLKACDNKCILVKKEIQMQKDLYMKTTENKKQVMNRIEKHTDLVTEKREECNSIRQALAEEEEKQHSFLTTKMELELQRKHLDEELRHTQESLSLNKKEYYAYKRKIRGKRSTVDGLNEVLPKLRDEYKDCVHLLKALKDELSKGQKDENIIKAEVDMYIAKYLKQEGIEKEDAEKLQAAVLKMEEREGELATWVAEDKKQNRLIQILTAHSEMKHREAARAKRNEAETTEAVKLKSMTIDDLSKKCTECNNRLKEFSALYDIVKNERNKYVSLIQISNQALAEMKEKVRILVNEMEILKNECKVKDREISKEQAQHTSSKLQRDALRYEVNRIQADYNKRQATVERQIVEIDKLNSLLNVLERKMLSLKGRYETAVKSRNLLGVQLIDRNDELCILYEKNNVQEETLKKGEMALMKKEEELRLLRLQKEELDRVIHAAQKQVSEVKTYAQRLSRLQQELSMEQTLTDRLCKDLENPSNSNRWRALSGTVPEAEQLLARIDVIEERINVKKEQLLEKELMLEEVTSLTVKLRNKAEDRREGAMSLASKASSFQTKIRNVTRKMMGVVAELSMYQATALRLQQEKALRKDQLAMAQTKLKAGEAPSEEAEKDWIRMERKRSEKEAKAAAKELYKQSGSMAADGDNKAMPLGAIHTSCVPRPTAYVEEHTGLPKPYGGMAPFKPTEVGSSMRHIIKPISTTIEI